MGEHNHAVDRESPADFQATRSSELKRVLMAVVTDDSSGPAWGTSDKN
jgi:hypothetical protein